MSLQTERAEDGGLLMTLTVHVEPGDEAVRVIMETAHRHLMDVLPTKKPEPVALVKDEEDEEEYGATSLQGERHHHG